MQEIAAGELYESESVICLDITDFGYRYSRDWRWHKELRQWMMKDNNYGMPIRITDKQERGFYIFFDVTNWRRERVSFVRSNYYLSIIGSSKLIQC